MKGFIHFIRTQGIVGLAIGFIIGGAAQQFVNALSTDILSPTIGLASGKFGNLASSTTVVAGQTFAWGHFISQFINLLLIALVVYIAVTYLHAKTIDAEKKEEK